MAWTGRIRGDLALGVLTAVVSIAAHAGYDEGMNALGTRDFAGARAQFEAAPTDPRAVYQLSRMASLGLGEAKDAARAAQLLGRAAEMGHVESQVSFAHLLANGNGVDKDVPRALRLFETAASKGSVTAQVSLGRAYLFGFWGLQKDGPRALEQLEKAIKAGSHEARAVLGRGLIHGIGVAKDEVRGLQLVREAAEGGHIWAINEYAWVLTYGHAAPKDEVAGAAWYRKSAERVDPLGQYGLGLAYLEGRGVPKDEAAAIRYIDAAARQGLAAAQLQLGEQFASGQGVPRMRSEAYFWYSVAANSGAASVQERANTRRANLASELSSAEIARYMKRVNAFRPQPGFQPRAVALPAPARGDRIALGSAHLTVPMPQGFANGAEFAEQMQRAYPNDPGLRPLLMVLTKQEDLDRVKLGIAGQIRSVEITRHVPDDGMTVTPQLFGDIKKQLRSQIEANIANGRFHAEGPVRDDDRVFSMIRSSVQDPNSVDALALVLVKEKVLGIVVSGFSADQKREVAALVKWMGDELLSSNREGFFSR